MTFSGDKLLGGPQAGMIAGKKEIVDRIRRNPLFRALRVDKLTIAALEATLKSYLRGALDEIPALRMIRLTADEIASRAEQLCDEIAAAAARRCGDSDSGRNFGHRRRLDAGSKPANVGDRDCEPTHQRETTGRKYAAARTASAGPENRFRLYR